MGQLLKVLNGYHSGDSMDGLRLGGELGILWDPMMMDG